MKKKDAVEMRSEYLNFIRFSVTESAAATFTQVEVDTNLSAERGVMMEIHSVDVDCQNLNLFDEVPAGGQESLRVQITRESKTALTSFNDADCLFKTNPEVIRSAAIGTDAGPLWFYANKVISVYFPLSMPYVKPSIFVGIQGTDAASTHTVTGRIGYTLREIEREDFLELLVALQ